MSLSRPLQHLRTAPRRLSSLAIRSPPLPSPHHSTLPSASTPLPLPLPLPLHPTRTRTPTLLAHTRPRTFTTTATRLSTPPWSSKGAITYSELKPITASPTGEITLIDVREPNEVAQGIIPSAVNVPLSALPSAFAEQSREANDFERLFAFRKPSLEDKLVVYCRSGKRSAQAMEVLREKGWKNVRNYEGSYLDWVQQEEANKGNKANQDDD